LAASQSNPGNFRCDIAYQDHLQNSERPRIRAINGQGFSVFGYRPESGVLERKYDQMPEWAAMNYEDWPLFGPLRKN